jgi:hypothetical protein
LPIGLNVTSSLHPFDRTAWLYTRGDASVAMTIEEQGDTVMLVIRGPGRSGASHEFASAAELAAFVREREIRLADEGFHLQAVVERRRAETPESTQPGAPDRRRH